MADGDGEGQAPPPPPPSSFPLSGPIQYDVILVGAGISGLAAANQLKHFAPGLKILVLEAGSTLGGRCKG